MSCLMTTFRRAVARGALSSVSCAIALTTVESLVDRKLVCWQVFAACISTSAAELGGASGRKIRSQIASAPLSRK